MGELSIVAAMFVLVPATGLGFHAARALSPAMRCGVLVVLVGLLLAVPLSLAAAAWPFRLLAAAIGAFTAIQLWDAHVALLRGRDLPPASSFVRSLFNPSCLVQRRASSEPPVSAAEDRRRGLLAALQITLGWLLLKGLYVIDFREVGLLVEHVFISLGFFVAVVGMFEALTLVARSLGGDAPRFSANPYIAVTPADFWRRYNRTVSAFLYEDVYRLIGRGRWPIGGTLVAFLVSGLIHEYVFAVAAWDLSGLLTGYFLIQGLAVVATAGMKPRGASRFLSIPLTWLFGLASALLFMAAIHRMVPLYTNTLPWGLGG